MYARLNAKVLFLTFFTIFMCGSAICGAAQSSVMLILGRAVAGFGAAGIMNGGFTMLNSCVAPQQRPGMLGIMMAFGNLGAAAGPLIGGAITQYATWRWCTYFRSSLLVEQTLIFPRFLHQSPRQRHRLPLLSMAPNSRADCQTPLENRLTKRTS